jgi:hypothetical protein
LKLVATYSHRDGADVWRRRGQFDWATDIFEAPSIEVGAGSTKAIREHVRGELVASGWAWAPRLSRETKLTVTAMTNDAAFQIQTGNVSRAAYDLVKLQYLYTCNRIETAILAVPSRHAAGAINSNVAHADRIWTELQLFDRVLTVPILLVEFE